MRRLTFGAAPSQPSLRALATAPGALAGCRLKVYLGTMTFGWSQASVAVDTAVAIAMVRAFAVAGGSAVDTARVYSGGAAEAIVGAACAPYAGTLRIGTKAHPSQPGGLGAAGVRAQYDASVAALGGTSVMEEFYLHQPDTEHSLRESLIAADALVRQGLVRRVGMSNYHASEVERAFALCRSLGLTPPSVYQGLYNPLNRMIEQELLPLLHRNVRTDQADPRPVLTLPLPITNVTSACLVLV